MLFEGGGIKNFQDTKLRLKHINFTQNLDFGVSLLSRRKVFKIEKDTKIGKKTKKHFMAAKSGLVERLKHFDEIYRL